MEKVCAICEKKSSMLTRLVKLRGKYNPTAKYRTKPNLQWTRSKTGERILACTKCMKRLAKV